MMQESNISQDGIFQKFDEAIDHSVFSSEMKKDLRS
jgi:hypothetical protein